jgi:hypothetical protein
MEWVDMEIKKGVGSRFFCLIFVVDFVPGRYGNA